jgi:GntR family transcriptional regulator, transcriptional repressor for pyruvate dehydrogenase complex
MSKIFRGEFPVGTRLPAERQLATQLGTDRTTLRMALKQLQRMNLVVVRHGSGVEVHDYRTHGGLDTLAAMFALDDVTLDASLVLEALEFWLEGFVMTAAKAISRMTLDEFRGLDAMLDHALACVGDPDVFLDSQLALQDELARLSGSVMFRMLSNSTLAVRRRLMRFLPEALDMTQSLGDLKKMLYIAVATRPGENMIRGALHEALGKQTVALREHILMPRAVRAPAPAKKRAARKAGNRQGNGGGGADGAGAERTKSDRRGARRRVR